MRTTIRLFGLLTIAFGAVLVLPGVWAGCTTGMNIVSTPFTGTTCTTDDACRADIESAWWGLTRGNPAILAGADNGEYNDNGTGGNQPWLYWNYGSTGEFYVFCNDTAGNTDGCVDVGDNQTGDIVVLAVCDPAGSWAVTTGTEDPIEPTVFRLQGGPLLPTPGVTVTGSSRLSSTQHQINLTGPSLDVLDNAYYPGPNQTTPSSDVIKGVRVFTKTVARNAAVGADRRIAAGWVDTGVVLTPGGSGSITVTCATNSDAYIGVAPVFDGTTPFNSGCVTAGPRLTQCGPTLAEPKGKFRIVDREGPQGQR